MKAFLVLILGLSLTNCGKLEVTREADKEIELLETEYENEFQYLHNIDLITFRTSGGLPGPGYSLDQLLELDLQADGKVRARFQYRNCDVSAFVSRSRYEEIVVKVSQSPRFIGLGSGAPDARSQTITLQPNGPNVGVAQALHLGEDGYSLGQPVLSQFSEIHTLIERYIAELQQYCPSISSP